MNVLTKNILITGATGMVGKALAYKLSTSGYNIYSLSRTDSSSPFYYDQAKGIMCISDKIPLLGVINLAGKNISDGRWSSARKKEIMDSRRVTTELLSQALSSMSVKPEFLFSASAIGFYGDSYEPMDESSSNGSGFLADVSMQTELATTSAQKSGIRVVQLRFGLILSPLGGVLKNFILPLGLATVGKIGHGNQYLSWVSIDDVLLIIEHLIKRSDFSGALNIVAPEVNTNLEFMTQLSKILKRPKLPPLPAFVVRLMFGEMADEALLLSSNIRSTRLQELELELTHPTLEKAFYALLKK
jgi:uncharacterized protein (TIGR01777 family)